MSGSTETQDTVETLTRLLQTCLHELGRQPWDPDLDQWAAKRLDAVAQRLATEAPAATKRWGVKGTIVVPVEAKVLPGQHEHDAMLVALQSGARYLTESDVVFRVTEAGGQPVTSAADKGDGCSLQRGW